jgi:hypothetical protein
MIKSKLSFNKNCTFQRHIMTFLSLVGTSWNFTLKALKVYGHKLRWIKAENNNMNFHLYLAGKNVPQLTLITGWTLYLALAFWNYPCLRSEKKYILEQRIEVVIPFLTKSVENFVPVPSPHLPPPPISHPSLSIWPTRRREVVCIYILYSFMYNLDRLKMTTVPFLLNDFWSMPPI